MRKEPYLVAPGRRKNNKHFLIRGTFYGKPDNELSTGTTNEELAELMRSRIVYEEKCGIQAVEEKYFVYAVNQYIAAKNPSERTRDFLRVLCTFWATTPIREVEEQIMDVANRLYPDAKGSTKNRAVLVPAYAVLNWAASRPRKWCDVPEMEKFKEEPVQKRAMTIENAQKLVKATQGLERLLLLWLFKHSDRITGSISVFGSDIYMAQDYYQRLSGKSRKTWQRAPLDPEVKKALIALFGRKLPSGRIFPWLNRYAVYRWLKPLCKRLGVKFTPHMARHSILTWIADAGGSSSQIKTRAGHASINSSEPYLAENLKATRAITSKFVLGKKRVIRRKTRGQTRGRNKKTGAAERN